MPSTVVAPSGTTYTISGFDIGNDSSGGNSGLHGASITEIYFPASLNCFLSKDCLRSIAPLTKVVFDPTSIVTGSSRNEPAGYGGDVFYGDANLKYIDFPASFNYWGREYFGACVPDTIILRNPNQVVDNYAANSLTNLNRSHNIYVPDHLVAAYQGIS
jgi:hypothetical protein